jgi:hypothetical protein
MNESILYKRFLSGLKNIYGLTFEDIKDWEYAGNDTNGKKYYSLRFPKSTKLPDYEDKCICGHFIINNSYITDNKRILVLGSCCVKSFMPTGLKRLCSKCHSPHRNRKINKCNDCRIGYCDICNTTIDANYKTCYSCKIRKS